MASHAVFNCSQLCCNDCETGSRQYSGLSLPLDVAENKYKDNWGEKNKLAHSLELPWRHFKILLHHYLKVLKTIKTVLV